VQACPGTWWYRTRKFVRRHRAVVGLAAALSIAILVGAGASMRQAKLALTERDRAVQMLEQATATNEFWDTVLSEGVANDETVSMPELLKRSEDIAEKAAVSSPLQYAVAVDSIASLYLSYGLPGKAETLLERTLDQYQGIREGEHVMCRLRCAHALAIGTLGRTQEADAIFSQVLGGVRNEPSVKQFCLQSWATVANENFDVSNALKYIQEAHRLQRVSPVRSPWQSAQLDGELAYSYAVNGKTDLAQQHYESAWKQYETIGRDESHVAVSTLNGWGILEIGRGDPAASLNRFDHAIRIARKRSPDGQPPPDLIFNRAIALAALGRFDEAEQQFDAMHARASADGNIQLAAGAVAGDADSKLRRGDFAGAKRRLDGMTAAERATLVPDSAAMLRFSVVEAQLLAQQGNHQAADALLTQALDGFARKGAIIRRRVLALTVHAELLLAMGRNEAAAIEAQHAVEMAAHTRGQRAHSDLVGLAHLAQGRIQLSRGDRAGAASSLNNALENLVKTLGDTHPDTRAAAQLVASLT
jgi:serine/threonine-protein kinase